MNKELLPWLTIHGLRHAHASLLISNGVELRQVAQNVRRSGAGMFSKIMA